MKAILIFLVVAFGGAWLLAMPMWLSGQGLATPGAKLILVAMMFTPTLGALIASRVSPSPEGFMRATGLRASKPFRAWWRYGLLAWLAPLGVAAAALVLAWALGVFHADLINFSGAAAQLDALAPGKPLPMSVPMLVAVQLAGMVFFGGFINLIPALGEEIGWRGFLQMRLMHLGAWPAVILTGVAWGLYHAPAILLGYNFPGLSPIAALAFMVVFCVIVSVLLGWLRLASGSIWPVALAHGVINATPGLGMLLSARGHVVDNVSTGLMGWTGWIILAALIMVLVATRRFPVPGTA